MVVCGLGFSVCVLRVCDKREVGGSVYVIVEGFLSN